MITTFIIKSYCFHFENGTIPFHLHHYTSLTHFSSLKKQFSSRQSQMSNAKQRRWKSNMADDEWRRVVPSQRICRWAGPQLSALCALYHQLSQRCSGKGTTGLTLQRRKLKLAQTYNTSLQQKLLSRLRFMSLTIKISVKSSSKLS